MPGDRRQSQAAFTRSPGAQSLGGVSERGGGHSRYRPRHLQGGAWVLADLKLRQSLQRVSSTCGFPARLRVPRAAPGHLRAVGLCRFPSGRPPALSRDTLLPGSRRRRRQRVAGAPRSPERRGQGGPALGSRKPLLACEAPAELTGAAAGARASSPALPGAAARPRAPRARCCRCTPR